MLCDAIKSLLFHVPVWYESLWYIYCQSRMSKSILDTQYYSFKRFYVAKKKIRFFHEEAKRIQHMKFIFEWGQVNSIK